MPRMVANERLIASVGDATEAQGGGLQLEAEVKVWLPVRM